jgi:hypothetical protein
LFNSIIGGRRGYWNHKSTSTTDGIIESLEPGWSLDSAFDDLDWISRKRVVLYFSVIKMKTDLKYVTILAT